MTAPNRKERTAKEIFHAAIEYYEPRQWEGFLVDACGDDKAKLERVRELLRAHQQEDRIFDEKAQSSDDDDVELAERPGSQIGCYKLLQEIGEGGFGVVYMAEQLEPVRRKVALKIIKPGMDTKQVIARFEAERQALAMMDHPNIAKVLDAGATESGRPYFVMELVKGVPVTEFCDKNNLSTPERLNLFVQICRAVQHAHQKGVIHRDLKPANVMVTLHDGHPVPMVIDFGVSKAISQQLTEKTLFTAYGQMIGTPQYMSPEQAEMSGLDVDTRSDVYSLGVLLYELLTGTTPLEKDRLNTLAYVEMQRVIREEEPQRPSARLSTLGGELTVLARHRSTNAKQLTQMLRGDLDWIVMKALSKERGRRYESASAFAADVERHLSNDTIEARPPSTAYQLSRVVRRNKGAAAAVAAIVVVLLLGIFGTTMGLISATNAKHLALDEADKARLAEEDARQAEAASRKAEGQVRETLERSEKLAGDLATSLSKLSENTSRLATQRAYTLVGQNRSQEGMHWLARAAELTPSSNKTLEREIRTAMSVVADTLPQPRYVIAPESERVFSRVAVSPNGARLALLAVKSRLSEAASLLLHDAVSGELIVRVDVPSSAREIGFSNDGKVAYVADGRQLNRWDAQTGARLGSDQLGSDEENDDQLDAMLERVASASSRSNASGRMANFARIRDFILSRRGPQVVALGSDGNLVLLSGLVPPDRESSSGRPAFSRGRTFRSGAAGTMGVMDLKSQQVISRLPSGTYLHFDDVDKRVLVSRFPRTRFDSEISPSLQWWDLAAGEWVEGWNVELERAPLDWSISKDGKLALIASRGSGSGFAGRGSSVSTVRVVDLGKASLRSQQLTLEGPALDIVLSPSGTWAAILWTPEGERPRMTVWDLNTDVTREVPIHLAGDVGLGNQPQFARGGGSARGGPGAFGGGGGGRGGPGAFGGRGGGGGPGGRFGGGGPGIGFGGGNPNRYQMRIAADEETLLIWNHDLLVSWRLPAASQTLPDFPTAAAVRQFCHVGQNELLTVVSGVFRGGRGGAQATPTEIQRWSTSRRMPIGDAIAVFGGQTVVSPDGRSIFLAQGNQVQRWDLSTLSKVADPVVCSGAVQQMELVANGRLLATYVAPQRPSRGGFRPTRPTATDGSPPTRGERSGRGQRSRITYQRIGVTARDSRTGSGLEVTSVEAGSGAEKAGVKVGDRIVLVGDVEVSNGETFRQLIDLNQESGLRLTLLQGDRERAVVLHPIPHDESVILRRIGSNPSLQLWEAQTGNRVGALPIPREGTSQGFRNSLLNTDWAAVSPDGKRVLTYCSFFPRAELRLFDANSGRPATVSRLYPRSIRWAGFGPRNKIVATLDSASSVQLWNAVDLSAIGSRIRPTGTVTAITFMPDGNLIIGARTSNGAQLTLWDTNTSQRLSLPIPLPVAASQLACNPDGNSIAVAASGGHFWLLPLPQPWTGEPSKIRQMVEAMTGTSLAESGDLDELETDRWSRQLSVLAESGKGQFDDRQVFVSLREAPPPGQVESAAEQLPALRAAVEEYPDRWIDRMALISVLLHLARFDEATEQMDVVLKTVDRGQVISWLKRGLRTNLPPAALLQAMRERGASGQDVPAAAPAAVQRWEQLIALRPWLIQQLRQLAPSDTGAQLASLLQTLNEDRFSQAEAIYQEATRGVGKDLMMENLVILARRDFADRTRQFSNLSPADAQKQYQRGRWLWDRLVAERPKDWELLMWRARQATAAEQWDAALVDIERAGPLAPADRFEASLRALGNTPFRSQGPGQTVASLSHVIAAWQVMLKMDPNHVAALEAVATSYARMAEWERTAEFLQRLSDATPDDHWPRYRLAPVLLKLDRVDEYRALCQALLEQFHDSAMPLHEGRAIQACLWREMAIDDPSRLVTRMQAINDTSGLRIRQSALGLAHFRNGNPAEAIEWLEKTLTVDRLNTQLEVRALAGLAMAHYQNDDPDQARETLRRASERYAEDGPSKSDDWTVSWHDWLICELLLNEAESRIFVADESPSTPSR